ncbi:pyrroline-5-carboxylate reductase [Anaerobacillus arseniciselenatis]|uniref:Pyrroline-5-carboxylate reductase n=1 Tax=Anaerobacillus arseniciselenatis TaxID=85682 RepID=A0A1S2LUF4_9BACI|nr:pyrroline-5-carboxylate reductase [Anaerobacillus arseniciselenatis]OIJ15976.1 pyrroline-5-carboxylate reductase [Anaerobacillus arseniciselenatis]
MLTNKKVAFIGAGSMAEAMISGILAKNILQPAQIYVTNRSNKEKLDLLQKQYSVEVFTNLQDVLPKMDIIIFAIKPKDITETIEKIKAYTTEKQVMISVLAGVSTSCISRLLKHEAPVIRTMPNTSAAVGQSITAIAPGSYAGEGQVTLTKTLLEAIGEVVIVEEEKLDAITGLSGSGPAYIYYLIEAMEIGAKEIGIDEKLAKQLIAQVLIGAAERVKSTDLSSQTLYKQVMSPGGTTEAGFKMLENYHYQEAMVECIKRAAQRSTELGKLYSFVK